MLEQVADAGRACSSIRRRSDELIERVVMTIDLDQKLTVSAKHKVQVPPRIEHRIQ